MMKETYSEEDILKSFQSAPEAVREILSSGELVELIFDMVKENSLPAEKTVLVARYNRNLLLGLDSPAEVLGNLIFAGIPAEKAQKILEELNKKVFIPTRKKMLHGNLPGQNLQQGKSSKEIPKTIERHISPEPTVRVPPPPVAQHVPPPPTKPDEHVDVNNIPQKDTAQNFSPAEAVTETLPLSQKRPSSAGQVTDPYRESFK